MTDELTSDHIGRVVVWTNVYGHSNRGVLYDRPIGGNGRGCVLNADGWWYVPAHQLELDPDDDRTYSAADYLAIAQLARLDDVVDQACDAVSRDHAGHRPDHAERARIATALLSTLGRRRSNGELAR